MRLVILFIILPISLSAQIIEYEQKDTLNFGSFRCPTYVLRISNYSASDPAKIFITNTSNFDTLKEQILRYYFQKKQEYNEYYLLGVADILKTDDVEKALTKFLNQIDSSRMKRNRSTFLRVYSWDNVNRKIEYQSTFKELSKIDNLYYLKSIKDICKYMACPR